VRKALGSLQFVEKASVTADIKSKRVTFQVKENNQLDMERVKTALKNAGFPEVEVITAPT
jgi:hypothetical protein